MFADKLSDPTPRGKTAARHHLIFSAASQSNNIPAQVMYLRTGQRVKPDPAEIPPQLSFTHQQTVGGCMANPNPSPSTRFGGENGNPSGAGKSKGQRAAEIRAAEISAILREKALSELLEKVETGELPASDLVDQATLKLFKDSEDRAHGTPKQSIDMESPQGTMTPQAIVRRVVDPKDGTDD